MSSKNYVITISRQFGSLGRPIAKKLADELSINYYDRDLIEKVADYLETDISEVSKHDENVRNPFWKMLFPSGLAPSPDQQKVFEMQKSMIIDLANSESCIIVGRCADYILKDYENCLNIYIYAPFEKRLENSINELGLSEGEAKEMIAGVDRARENYYRFYTGMAPDCISGRHLMIDSSVLSMDGTVDFLRDYVKRRFELS